MALANTKWRKKYMLVVGMFLAGSCHAFLNSWSAGELTMFYGALLAIFGPMDLADNGKLQELFNNKRDTVE